MMKKLLAIVLMVTMCTSAAFAADAQVRPPKIGIVGKCVSILIPQGTTVAASITPMAERAGPEISIGVNEVAEKSPLIMAHNNYLQGGVSKEIQAKDSERILMINAQAKSRPSGEIPWTFTGISILDVDEERRYVVMVVQYDELTVSKLKITW